MALKARMRWVPVLLIFAVCALGCESREPASSSAQSGEGARNLLVSAPHDAFYGGAALDAQRIWLVGRFGEALVTEDGGAHWQRVNVGTTKALFDLAFFDEKHGIAVGEEGTCLRTSDGGKTWHPQDVEVSVPLFTVRVVDERRAFIVGGFGTILRTEDGGEDWEQTEIDWETVLPEISEELVTYEPSLYSVAFTAGGEGWIVGEYGIIIASDDGGQIWRTVREGRIEQGSLFSIAFLNDKRGVAVGQQGTILRTVDGGEVWTPCPSPTSRDLYDVALTPEGGFAVGAARTVIVSDTSLCSWRELPRKTLESPAEGSAFFPWLGVLVAVGGQERPSFFVVGQGAFVRKIEGGGASALP